MPPSAIEGIRADYVGNNGKLALACVGPTPVMQHSAPYEAGQAGAGFLSRDKVSSARVGLV